MAHGYYLLLATAVMLFADAANAVESFAWGLPSNNLDSALTECEPVTVTLYDGASPVSDRAPPFTMYAYPTEGAPSQTSLGGSDITDGSHLSWTPAYAAGTELTIGVFDADGVNGGWVGVFTVASGDSSCLPSSGSSSDVKVTLNATSVDVCDALGISVSGGTPPYTMNILPSGTISSDLNYTLPSADTWFSWVANTTNPNTMLIGVRDSQGVFADSPPTVEITGSNATCDRGSAAYPSNPNLSSSGAASIHASSTSSSGGSSPTTTGTTGSTSGGGGGGHSNHAGAIAGGVVGGVVGAALLAVLAWLCLRRRVRSSDSAVARERGWEKDDAAVTGGGGWSSVGFGRSGRGGGGERDPSPTSERLHHGEPDVVAAPASRYGRGAGKGRRARVPPPEPEDDIEAVADAPEARITPFMGGLPRIAASDRSPMHEDGPGRLVPPERLSTPDSVREVGALGLTGLRIANPDETRMSMDSRFSGEASPPRNVAAPAPTPAAAAAAAPRGEKSEKMLGEERQRRWIQHEDAGSDDGGHGKLEELPPAYTSLQQKNRR